MRLPDEANPGRWAMWCWVGVAVAAGVAFTTAIGISRADPITTFTLVGGDYESIDHVTIANSFSGQVSIDSATGQITSAALTSRRDW